LAVTVDCNSRYVYADPEQGCAIAVAEAARNISCSGGVPSAVTNCLNFGNPYNPEVYWQFVGAIKGMSKACEKFKTPVTGGNVSFYNQTVTQNKEEAVFPTPTIGMVGLVASKKHITGVSFQNEGDLIVLLGKSWNDIAGSEYLASWHKVERFPAPHFDLDEEATVQSTVQSLIGNGLIKSAHDCADGGLFTTLLESCYENSFGFDIKSAEWIRKDAFLFGEAQSRIVVSCSVEKLEDIKTQAANSGCAIEVLGKVNSGEVLVDGQSFGKSTLYKDMHLSSLEANL